MIYTKDSGQYKHPLNYAGTFAKIDQTALSLINTCKYVFKDLEGEYAYEATSFDDNGNVYFTKKYLKN